MLESRGTCKRTRAWRRYQRRRMIAKACRIAKERYPSPEGMAGLNWLPWRDVEGQWRLGPVTWEDVFAHRDRFAHRNCDHLARCSCPYCNDRRRVFMGRTVQERRSDDNFRTELAEFALDRAAANMGQTTA